MWQIKLLGKVLPSHDVLVCKLHKRCVMRAEKFLLKDLVLTFQSASQALEKSYRELQNHMRILTEDLEREREKRIQLERLAAMGEMAMELAHEIRNPLASIELFASMIEG